MNLTLITGEHTKLNQWVAESMIEKQRRENPTVPVAFFFYAPGSDGIPVLANRDMFWMAMGFGAESVKAAVLALGHSLKNEHNLEMAVNQIPHTIPVFICAPESMAMPVKPTTHIHIS